MGASERTHSHRGGAELLALLAALAAQLKARPVRLQRDEADESNCRVQ